MRHLSVLLVFTVLIMAGSANAQAPSKINGKSYTYVMKNINGLEDEIIDKITFTGTTVSSEKFAASSGFKSGNIVERAAANNGTSFEVTLSDGRESMKYNAIVTDQTIDGTVIVTDKSGNQTTMALRGMASDVWDNVQKEKSEYKETQK